MYTVTHGSSQEWPAALLLLLALLTAHARLCSSPALADGWATALRPLHAALGGNSASAIPGEGSGLQGDTGRGMRAPSEALVGRMRTISSSVEAESPPVLSAPGHSAVTRASLRVPTTAPPRAYWLLLTSAGCVG